MKVYLTAPFTPAITSIRRGLAWNQSFAYPKHSRVQVAEPDEIGSNYYYEYVAKRNVAAGDFPDPWDDENLDWEYVTENPEQNNPWWLFTETYSIGDQVNFDQTGLSGGNVYYSYESLIDNNSGNNPYYDDGTNWLTLGPANAAAMFDDSNNTKTVVQDSAKYMDNGNPAVERDGAHFALHTNGYSKALILLGLEGVESLTIVQKNSVGTPIKSETTSDRLWKPTEVFHFDTTTWSATYIIEVYMRQPAAMTGQEYLPLKIGNVLISNNIIELGLAQWGVQPGITTYSTFDTNEWGTTTFVPRVSQRDVNGTIEVDTELFDETFFVCENLTQSLAFYDFNNDDESDYDSLRVYGVLTSMSPNMQSGVSTIDLTVRGYV